MPLALGHPLHLRGHDPQAGKVELRLRRQNRPAAARRPLVRSSLSKPARNCQSAGMKSQAVFSETAACPACRATRTSTLRPGRQNAGAGQNCPGSFRRCCSRDFGRPVAVDRDDPSRSDHCLAVLRKHRDFDIAGRLPKTARYSPRRRPSWSDTRHGWAPFASPAILPQIPRFHHRPDEPATRHFAPGTPTPWRRAGSEIRALRASLVQNWDRRRGGRGKQANSGIATPEIASAAKYLASWRVP